MPGAVRFEEYGGVEVLKVLDVPRPVPGPGQVLVRVVAAGLNPRDTALREGLLALKWPTTFPSGQGSDFAGIVEEVGKGVTAFRPGEEVIGFSDRQSQARLVCVESDHLTARPPNVPWVQAGSLFVVGSTAFAALRAVGLKAGETLVVSGAAGGVGSVVVQLARNLGAKVIGISGDGDDQWLTDHGAIPVSYGRPDLAARVRAAAGGHVDAFIDTFGHGYVDLAIELEVPPQRIDTIIDFVGAQKHGTKMVGSRDAGNARVLAELAALISAGRLEIPIASEYPLSEVQAAYRELERRHCQGKIVLIP